jgi:hypothetical protein
MSESRSAVVLFPSTEDRRGLFGNRKPGVRQVSGRIPDSGVYCVGQSE